MVAPLIAAALPLFGKVIDRAIPDKAEAEKIKSTIALQSAELETDIIMSQLDLAKQDAKSGKGGFRDLAGRVTAVSVFYAWFAQPLLGWVCPFLGITPPPPIDPSVQVSMLGGMLGLSGIRSYDLREGTRR